MASQLFKFKFSKTKPFGEGSDPSSTGTEDRTKLSDSTFVELRDVIYKLCGIYYTESKKYLLEGRIAKRIDARNLNSFEEYVELLKSPYNRQEMKDLFEVITINETYFFRAYQQFEAFETVIVPEVIEQRQKLPSPTIKIWSSASSTGEEPYTIAIIILERLRHLYPRVNFQILASDISNVVIENAKRGIYKEYSVRNIPPFILKKYFTQSGNTYTINDEVKRLVKFTSMNLYDPIAIKAVSSCDVIFCCNVLIYFDIPSKQQVVSNLYDAMNKGGYLFIGYSESLHGISKAFKLVHLPKAMAYKKE